MRLQYPITIPELVSEQRKLAAKLGFNLRPEGHRAGSTPSGPSACLDEVGSLLRTLTATIPTGRIAEVGTGAGIGSAWIASALQPAATLTTVELDPLLAEEVRTSLAGIRGVEVLTGDWQEVLPPIGPFDLVFFDGGGPAAFRIECWPMIAALLKQNGTMVIDDLTPEDLWPDSWRGKPDPKRELAWNSGLFTATELQVRPDAAVLLLVRT